MPDGFARNLGGQSWASLMGIQNVSGCFRPKIVSRRLIRTQLTAGGRFRVAYGWAILARLCH